MKHRMFATLCGLVGCSGDPQAGSSGNASALPDAGLAVTDGGRDSAAATAHQGIDRFFPGHQSNTGAVGFRYPLSGATLSNVMLTSRFTKVAGRRPCDTRPVGPDCVVNRCTTDSTGVAKTEGAVHASAGTISVVGGNPTFSLVSKAVTGDYFVEVAKPVKESFDRGDRLRIKASGAEIPGFDLEMQFPIVLHLASPVADRGGRIDLAAADTALEFSRGAPDVELWLLGEGQATPGASLAIECHFDSNAGTGQVPGEVLGELNPGAELFAFTVRRTEVRHGDFVTVVALLAQVYTSDPTKRAVSVYRK